jgi:hypothetical protein
MWVWRRVCTRFSTVGLGVGQELGPWRPRQQHSFP